MDLSFTPEEQKFREDIRAWVKENLPKDIAHKVHNALELTRDDMQRWAKILGKNGWLGYGWPKEFGGPGWTAVQKHLFEEEAALAGAVVEFALVQQWGLVEWNGEVRLEPVRQDLWEGRWSGSVRLSAPCDLVFAVDQPGSSR